MKPTVTRENIKPLIAALRRSGRDESAACVETILTERDEAIREVERLSKENLLAAENIGLRSRVSHWVELCEAEKRRTAAFEEVAATERSRFMSNDWPTKKDCEEAREYVRLEAQKLLAPSDSGGEK